MDKQTPMKLENIVLYSDVGLSGRCPRCRELNSIHNEKCIGCEQLLRNIAKEEKVD